MYRIDRDDDNTDGDEQQEASSPSVAPSPAPTETNADADADSGAAVPAVPVVEEAALAWEEDFSWRVRLGVFFGGGQDRMGWVWMDGRTEHHVRM